MQELNPEMESILKGTRMRNETTESIISYGLGCGTALLGWICEATTFFQALALLIGVVVISIRAVHDGVRLFRFLREK